MLRTNPIRLNFSSWRLLKDAESLSGLSDDDELKLLLRKAIFYSYITASDVNIDVEFDSTDPTSILNSHSSANDVIHQLSSADALIASSLLTNITDHFSSQLFQPQAAVHMDCSNVYATLWMPVVVSPALEDHGVCDPFRTLRSVDWNEEDRKLGGDGSRPCTECIEHMKSEWEGQGNEIWKRMDGWVGSSTVE